MYTYTKLLIIFAIFFFQNACTSPITTIDSINKEVFSVEEQQYIGRVLKREIEAKPRQFPRLSRTAFKEAYDYVETLLNQLRNTPNVSRRNEYDWEITILRNDKFRSAFMLPGGHLYIYTGLLKFIETESELAAIIGHEIYYVDTDNAVDRLLAEYGGIALGDILLDKNTQELEEIVDDLPYMAYDEELVAEGDHYAVKLLCPFAYEATGITSVLNKSDSLAMALEWAVTHPREYSTRMEHISSLAKDELQCGEGETFRSRYQDFIKNKLP